MKLASFHCDVFELSFRIGAEEIDKLALFGRHDRAEADRISLIINSKEDDKQHSHVQVRFFSKDSAEVRVSYHNSGGDTDENTDEPPHMEDCVPWLGTFIKPDKVEAALSAFYIFDDSFSPTISLPFPLAPPNEALGGSSVIGLFIKFPEDSPLDSAIVQHGENSTVVSILMDKEIELKKFDLYKQLKELRPSVASLVEKRQKGKAREKRSKK